MNAESRKTEKARRRGFGLLETIIALSILITGIVSLMGLVVAASTAQTLSAQESVASNLAREAIEYVVNVRNINWTKGVPFDIGIRGCAEGVDCDSGQDRYHQAVLSRYWTDGPIGFTASNLIPQESWCDYPPGTGMTYVFQYAAGPYAGMYAQPSSGDCLIPPYPGMTDAIRTMYRRTVTLDPICTDGVTEQVVAFGPCPVATTKIGIRVTSAVQWTERTRTHQFSLVETLYDWR